MRTSSRKNCDGLPESILIIVGAMEQEEVLTRAVNASSPEDFNSAARKQRIKQKTAQRKHKNISEGDDLEKNDSSTSTKPTREERMQIQKLKNRESAQRSRDQRKEYIVRLEQHNGELQHELDVLREINRNLSNSKLCSRCAAPLEKTTCDILEPELTDEF